MTTSVLFDASRLLSRVERTAPTGVDRVCLAYAEWLLSRSDLVVTPVRTSRDQLVVVDEPFFRDSVRRLRSRWNGGLAERTLDPEERRLVQALSQPGPAPESIMGVPPAPAQAKVGRPARVWSRFFRSRWTQALPEAAFYFNVGHTGLVDDAVLGELASRGVERIVMLHDLIPITHPEFCRPGDSDKHRERVLSTLRHASRVLVNSRYTADELTAFARREHLAAPPIDAIHLGLEPSFLRARPARDAAPYFVHVGTIEGRKNLAFLLTVWRRLAERLGDGAPQLLLVGRYGWENEVVLDHLQRSPPLRGLVHQASNLPDSTLATLMAAARAVLAPSSVEGFDLPAVEAMAMGVPLIASDIPAHRELVPEATLLDPLDGLGWLDALEAATRSAPPAPPYTAPSWDAHFAEVSRRLGL